VPRAIRDHVVVCGLGNIGYRVVEQLVGMGVPVVAAEQHEANRFLPVVRRLGVPVLIADVRLTETCGRCGCCRPARWWWWWWW
jgi:voltage-gated potassium channel